MEISKFLKDADEKIYANPSFIKDTWYGETYLKWSSFTKTTPLENMLKLTVPILYIAGGKNNNQTIIVWTMQNLSSSGKAKAYL